MNKKGLNKMLTPEINDNLAEVTEEAAPSLGYQLDFERNRARGLIDDFAAARQAITLMLATEQGEHEIYPEDYGLKVIDLIGKPYSYVANELQRRIKETLLKDNRVTAVHSFTSTHKDDELAMRFQADTIYGSFQAEKEVII